MLKSYISMVPVLLSLIDIPISSAITTVGETLITKETDVIQSVADVGAGSVLFNDVIIKYLTFEAEVER